MRVIRETIDKTKQYDVDSAISLLKKLSSTHFIESFDVSIKTRIDPRKSEQNVRGSTVLPYGSGRIVRVAVFAQGEHVESAKLAKADFVGMEDLAEKIKKNEINFDVLIVSPDTMWLASQLGQILGPKGLMPNLKTGTITQNISNAIKNAKSGQIHYRNDQNGIIHTTFGKTNFHTNALKENLRTLLLSLKKLKPIQVKGAFLKKISISTTMGAGITINQASLDIEVN